GNVAHTEESGDLRHGENFRVRHEPLELVGDEAVIRRRIRADQDLVDVVGGGLEILKCGERDGNARELAALDDAANVPVVPHEVDVIAGVEFLLGRVEFVDEHVVRALKRASGDVLEAAVQTNPRRHVDPGNNQGQFDIVNAYAARGFDVRLFFDDIDVALRERLAAEAYEIGRRGAAHVHVRAGAALALASVLQLALSESDERKDESDRDADEQHAEETAHGPVFEI